MSYIVHLFFFHLITDVYYIFLRWVNWGIDLLIYINFRFESCSHQSRVAFYRFMSVVTRHVWLPTWGNGDKVLVNILRIGIQDYFLDSYILQIVYVSWYIIIMNKGECKKVKNKNKSPCIQGENYEYRYYENYK